MGRGRARRAGKGERDDHELLSALLLSRGGEVLELEPVGDEHLHRHYL
jgi:hypothetical protein